MSKVRSDNISNRANDGAPKLTFGAEVPVGYGITGAGGINITGVVTATSFSGDGSGLTGVISGVELQFSGASVGAAVTNINFSGVSSVTAPVAGLSTITIAGFTSARAYTFNQLFS